MSKVIMPSMIRKLNERQVFMAIQKYGPISRVELCRRTELSPRAVIRMVSSLEKAGLIEIVTEEVEKRLVGRPVVFYRLATTDVILLGVVFEMGGCWAFPAKLDGTLFKGQSMGIAYESSYESLMDRMHTKLGKVRDFHKGKRILGLVTVVPGLIDNEKQEVIDAPTTPCLNGHRPGVYLAERAGLESLLVRDIDALCMAEQFWGNAQGLEHFAVVDIEHAFNVAVVHNGRSLTEQHGRIAQFGNVRTNQLSSVDGNADVWSRIEESLNEADMMRRIATKFNLPLDTESAGRFVKEIPRLCRGEKRRGIQFNDTINIDDEIDSLLNNLAVVLELMIYAFCPSVLFVRTSVLDFKDGLFKRLIDDVRSRLPKGEYDQCRILRMSQSEGSGAIALCVKHLTDRIGPEVQR